MSDLGYEHYFGPEQYDEAPQENDEYNLRAALGTLIDECRTAAEVLQANVSNADGQWLREEADKAEQILKEARDNE
jgi:uncharacterized tellurite resistance protein B-like protein